MSLVQQWSSKSRMEIISQELILQRLEMLTNLIHQVGHLLLRRLAPFSAGLLIGLEWRHLLHAGMVVLTKRMEISRLLRTGCQTRATVIQMTDGSSIHPFLAKINSKKLNHDSPIKSSLNSHNIFVLTYTCDKFMQSLEDYNEISRNILRRYDERLCEELHNLINNGKQIAQISKLVVGDHELILLYFQNIPTTMILSEEWPRKLVTPKRSFGFIAEAQSQGKGQSTNTWSSPPGNMYLTLLIEKEVSYCKYFSMLMANTTIRIIKTYFEDVKKAEEMVKCKWVNDIFIGNLKICGSLIRFSQDSGKFYFEIGVGVNLKARPIQGSTCLENWTKNTVNIREFTAEYARSSLKAILDLKSSNIGEISQEYKQKLLYRFQKVNIFSPDMKKIINTGIFEDITEEGYAILLNEKQQRQIITTGKMRPIFLE